MWAGSRNVRYMDITMYLVIIRAAQHTVPCKGKGGGAFVFSEKDFCAIVYLV